MSKTSANGSAPVEHARLPPSSADRWTVCTASIGFIERNRHLLPPDGSVYADEGTKAHALAASVLLGERRIMSLEEAGDADMLVNVRAYIDFVRAQQQAGDQVAIERKVSLFYLPRQRGTVDVRLTSRKRVAIIDLKYGAGVGVYAERNKQLAIYAESAIQELELADPLPDDLPVDLFIYQPRDRNDSEPIRSWHLTRHDLREFTRPIDTTAKAILANPEGGEFVPGEKQCRFCPAKGICKAYATQGLEAIPDAPVDVVVSKPVTLPDPASLTRDQRVRVLQYGDALRGWLDAVEAQEMHDLLNGAEPRGYKLVEGKSNRKWIDDEAVTKLMAAKRPIDEVAPRSPLSPAQAEKAFKSDKGFLAELDKQWVKPKGKPALVPESDSRPALVLNAAEGLENIDLI